MELVQIIDTYEINRADVLMSFLNNLQFAGIALFAVYHNAEFMY